MNTRRIRQIVIGSGLLVTLTAASLLASGQTVSALFHCPQTLIELPGPSGCGPPVELAPTEDVTPPPPSTTSPSSASGTTTTLPTTGPGLTLPTPVVTVTIPTGIYSVPPLLAQTNQSNQTSSSSTPITSPINSTVLSALPTSNVSPLPVTHPSIKHPARHHRNWFQRLLKDLHL
jgi:hypothetical protein